MVKLMLIHFALLLVFLLATIAGLSYFLVYLHDRNESATVDFAVESTLSPTSTPSVALTTDVPSVSLSPTTTLEPTLGSPTSQPTRRPTWSPTSPPMRSPTSYPTVETEQSYFMGLMARISPTTAMAIENANSNHYRAFRWLTNDPDFYSYDDNRLIQRWVLAFFNLEVQIFPPPTPEPSSEPTPLPSEPTTESPSGLPITTSSPTFDPFPDRRLNWDSMESWMKYTDECQWFTSFYFNNVACNSRKEYKRFVLINLGLEGTLPSELTLLSKLEVIAFPENKITGTIPEEFGSLLWLNTFNVSDNFLEGTIPAELGNAKALDTLDVGNNLLSGPVPSRICSLDLVIFRGDCSELSCTCCTRCAVPLPTD